MKRDTQLDIYRAISIIYVICVTHVLFWLNIGSEPVLSLILIEMPIIFFISGAALSLKTSPYGLLENIWNRMKRVVFPYYIYASVMVGIIVLLTIICFYFQPQFENIYGLKLSCDKIDIGNYAWADVVAILSCSDIPQAPFSMHLWFILPYLILSSSFSLQIKLIKITNRWIYISFAFILFLTIQLTISNLLINHIFFYNIFMIIGYLFYKQINMWQVFITGGIALAILVVYFLCGGWVIPMQCHKFPPDYVFLSYNLFVLCILSLIFNKISIPNLNIFHLWNTRGYTIYLYQNIIFFLVYPFYIEINNKIPNRIVQWGICAIIIFVLSTIVSRITYPFERIIMSNLKK